MAAIRAFMLHLLKKGVEALLEVLAFFPVVLVIAYVFIPDMHILIFVLLLIMYYLVGLSLGKIALPKFRNYLLCCGFIIPILAAYFIHSPSLAWIAMALLACGLYFRGFKSSEIPYYEGVPAQIFWGSYILYFVALFFFQRIYALNHYVPYLAWGVFLSIVVGSLSMNIQQLKLATLSDNRKFLPPSGVMRKNIALVSLLLIIIVAVSSMQSITEAMIWLWDVFIKTVFMVVVFLHELLFVEQPPQGMPSPGMGPLGPLEITEQSANPIWELIIDVLGTIILIALAILMIYIIINMLVDFIRAAIKKLFEFIKDDGAGGEQEESGFTDQRESLLNLSKLGENYANRLRSWAQVFLKREKSWEALNDNIERIRYLYKYILAKYMAAGYEYKQHLTPKEMAIDVARWRKEEKIVIDEMAALYTGARYGNKDAGDQKVNSLKDKIMGQ